MKNSTVSRNMVGNEKIIRQVFEYNNLQYQSSYMNIIQNYANRCFDQNINLMPVIQTLKKLNGIMSINQPFSETADQDHMVIR